MLRTLTKHTILAVSIFAVLAFLVTGSLHAQSIEISPDPSIVNIRPINFPLFISLEQARNFSVYSYISLLLGLAFVLLTTYWVFKIIAAAVNIIQSQGDSGKVAESIKKIQAVFIGIMTLFLFVAGISVVGAIFNLGNFFEWPKKLSICTTGEFYVTKALEMNTSTEREVDAACFSSAN